MCSPQHWQPTFEILERRLETLVYLAYYRLIVKLAELAIANRGALLGVAQDYNQVAS